ncbi:zinc finger CCCH domain-containing protein 53-like isoform X2 [Lycium ferocissimum]|uniref:zinc finger CCCH domain-containing protein 53-like isoform X2 n=1 Tax=Lycium ferocissimum TaxID=112874 RepID=UPI00281547F1|nr:zinc finger CCCH domain-containing protein 53-like isoform X2 [Lycium ferocissimum]
MDAYEATKIVLSRIQNLDPENASKIMGYILIQDQGDKEMIRLAFGPETHLISLINQAKSHLGLSSNTSSATSSRILIPNNGGVVGFPSPHSPCTTSPWSTNSSLSYAAVVNNGSIYSNNNNDQNNDDLSFLDESIISPSGRSDSLVWSNFEETPHLHRRSCSVNDVFVDDNNTSSVVGFGGWKPCMYYARGFCKNGNTCKFMHSGDSCSSPDGGSSVVVGSPSSNKVDSFDHFLRMKALQQQQQQQQRFAAASLMASGAPPHHPIAYNKCMNILNDNQSLNCRSAAAAAFMMGEEFQKFGRCRSDRNDFSAMALGGISNSSMRQIYLTFPADSTFKEEDVSNYFSMYGPVQDVRIPYQQKRMFGFVTFVYPETVKLILAKGNPHFVCDSRVLVKPYKEKGKIADKKHPIDRGEMSTCLSPSGLESREPYDLPFGGRMFYNSHEMMLRRKIEQEAELQQAIELQGRRLMNLQLLDLKNQHRNDPFPPNLSPQFHSQNSHSFVPVSNGIAQEIPAESNDTHEDTKTPPLAADEKVPQEMLPSDIDNENGSKEQTTDTDNSNLHESMEHILPDNLFASPTKSAAEHQAAFSSDSAEGGISSPITSATSNNNIPMLPATSTLNMASLKSCYFHMPRFTSGQEAIEM